MTVTIYRLCVDGDMENTFCCVYAECCILPEVVHVSV